MFGNIILHIHRYSKAKGGECFIKDGYSSLEKTGTPTKFLFYDSPDRSVSTGKLNMSSSLT